MFNKNLLITALVVILVSAAGFALASDQDQIQDRDQDRLQDQDQDRIYGSQLMTEQERNQYRKKIRTAKTDKEREQIRAEHHKLMQVRAKERGMTLPDVPPASRGGMSGGGMGPGGGMGGGGKR